MKHTFRVISLFVLSALILYSLSGAIPATAATAAPPPPDGFQFLTGPAQGSPQDIALGYIQSNKSSLGLSAADLSDFIVTDQYTDRTTGTTHIYLRQRYQGIEVDGANININVARKGSIINMHSDFVPDLAAAVNTTRPTQTPAQAIESAASSVGLDTSQPATPQAPNGSQNEALIFNPGSIPSQPIPVKLVYSIVSPKAVHLAWNVQMNLNSGEHFWSINVDAQDSQVLKQYDFVSNDTWGQAVTDSTAEAGDAASVAGGAAALAAAIGPVAKAPAVSANTTGGVTAPAANKAPAPAAPQAPLPSLSGTYNVYPIPIEAPSFGSRSLVAPSDALASPYGWHDTNGAAGAEFTTTRGNNVYAATDLDANNLPDPGSSPDGGPSLTFDFPLDLSQGPETYRPAAVTNLFYWNNIAHDVFYRYGFDELSGNFQQNNYGRGGLGNDYVNADAQDGSGTNNANFGTPPDGASGRMQMFVWTNSTFTLTVQAPPGIAGTYPAVAAAFGPATYDVSAATELASPANGCTAITNNVSGKIAIVDRGTCTFAIKVQNLQNAGAIGVIVVQNSTAAPIAMGCTAGCNLITIPSAMVDRDTVGAMLKANIPATLRLQNLPDVSRDSDLDTGVMVHEYGHGVSNRLVGGPSNVGCLSNPEQMGEGWSDILALILTARSTYTENTPLGVGTYLTFEPPNGLGIRPTPYTTNMAVNPSTYGMVGPIFNEVHDTGYVWTSILYEVYWNLVNKYGFNPNIYGAWNTGGNNLTLQLIMDGLKLTNCSPGFVDGRNAIIAADVVLTGGQNYCEIWSGFAKRGLGYLADQGSSNSTHDQTEDFSMPSACGPAKIQVTPTSLTSTPSFTLKENKTLEIANTNAPAGANTQSNSNHAIGQDVNITNVLTPTVTQNGTFQTTIAVSQTVQLNVRTYGAAAAGTDIDLYVLDSLNNVVGSSAGPTDSESVTVILPADGVYTLEVDGYDVPGGSTTFNLASSLIKLAGAGPATYFSTTVAVTTTNVLKVSTGGTTHASDLSLFLLDNANNVVGSSTLNGTDEETVVISQPISGTYSVYVFGPNVPTGTDTFDLHIQKISGMGTALTWSISEAPVDCSSPADIPWVSVSTASGSTGAGLSSFPDVHFDGIGLDKGSYTGFLCLTTNDPTAALVSVPLTLNVDFVKLYFSVIGK